MKAYLSLLFGNSIPMDESDWRHAQDDDSETYVFNKLMPSCRLLSLVLKRHNRKKINTHEWFFRAFATPEQCKYAFTTDTGTIFAPGAVETMVAYMDGHPRCSACTGRQRVMTWQQQSDPDLPDSQRKDTLFQSAMRAVQGWEFEADHCGSKPTSSLNKAPANALQFHIMSFNSIHSLTIPVNVNTGHFPICIVAHFGTQK